MTMIKQYIFNKKNQRRGLLIGMAVPPELHTELFQEKYVIGWSGCNLKKDRFDKTVATNIAAVRGEKAIAHKTFVWVSDNTQLPEYVRSALMNFEARCNKYFKSK